RQRGRRSSGGSQRATFGFSWISEEKGEVKGEVTGWTGQKVVVCLPDGRRAKVPACPCCGPDVKPYTSEQWASGKLTKRGAPKKNDRDNPRKEPGRCPAPAEAASWLESHAQLMSDDLMEFFHLLKSTLSRLRKKADVTSPRSSEQKAKAGRGNRKARAPPAERAPPAKRHKRRV
ncbi:hypothetical protein COHA_006311, partial [Chlorella ohadii]